MDVFILLCLETALGRRSIALMRWQLIILVELLVFFFFTYSALQPASYQKRVQGAYGLNPVCMHIFHAHP